MSMRRPRTTGETMAEAMDSVLWDYAPERERTPRGYSTGDFFDSFTWAEREEEAGASGEGNEGQDSSEQIPRAR